MAESKRLYWTDHDRQRFVHQARAEEYYHPGVDCLNDMVFSLVARGIVVMERVASQGFLVGEEVNYESRS